MLSAAVALDTETHRVAAGLLAPPLVCGSVAVVDLDAHTAAELATRLERAGRHDEAAAIRRQYASRPAITGELLGKREVLDLFVEVLEDPTKIIVAANGAYDLAVLANEWRELGVDVLPLIFTAFQDQRIFDIQI